MLEKLCCILTLLLLTPLHVVRGRRIIIIEDVSSQEIDTLTGLSRALHIPDPNDAAKMARYIVHKSNWTSIAYTSHQANTAGMALADMWSVADGSDGELGSGVPYFYVSRLELAVTDLLDNDNHLSLMMSLAETDICKNQNWDPEDPRCAHVIMTGTFHKMNNDSAEYVVAQNAVFSRHPDFIHLPPSHQFFLAKFNINSITVQDNFGGPVDVSVSDYFKVDHQRFASNLNSPFVSLLA